jgi:hypothetical protein
LTAQEAVTLRFEPFKVSVYDTASLFQDIGWAYVYTVGGIQPADFVFVSEWVQIALTHTAWYLGVADNVIVIENLVYGLDPIPLSAITEVYVNDVPIMHDIVIELGPVTDDIYLQDLPLVALEILPIEVFDDLLVTEEVVSMLMHYLAVFDQISTSEQASMEALIGITRFDLISVLEAVFSRGISYLDVWEDIQISEEVSREVDRYNFQIEDNVTLEESVTYDLLTYLFAYDLIAKTEEISVTLDQLGVEGFSLVSLFDIATTNGHPIVTVFDGIQALPEVFASLDLLWIDLWDDLLGQDELSLLIDCLVPIVEDSIASEESFSLLLPYLNFSANSAITVADISSWLIPESSLAVSDQVWVEDLFIEQIGTEIAVFDDLLVEDWTEVLLAQLKPFIFESITVEEDFASVLLFLIYKWETISLNEILAINYPLDQASVETIEVAERFDSYFGIEFFGIDSITIEESELSVLPYLLINVNSLASGIDECYIVIEFQIFSVEAISATEWFVWGLPIQFIDVSDEVLSGELTGIYIEPFEQFPMIFGSSKHGDW